MGFKFATVFSVAVFCVLVHGQLLDIPLSNPNPNNRIERLLQKLEGVVNNALQSAHQQLESAANRTIEASGGTEEKAEQSAVNIDMCISEDMDNLESLPGYMTDLMVHCVTDRVTEGVSYITDAINKLQTFVKIISSVNQNVRDCGSGLSSIRCLVKLAIKIEKDTITIPIGIAADVAGTTDLISNLEEKNQLLRCRQNGRDDIERRSDRSEHHSLRSREVPNIESCLTGLDS
ncbi:hypothetical protein NQ318_000458 [Aromia moschata]|uniref:Secreted protein n=1 Tax=Aromia moschata TaxID=1265417 RepID=A0AAV8YSR8_9CUCU|nr:hypothetical protein NQ318_000458 [Aromia moschata]